MKRLKHFLFGSPPKIIFENGEVRHNLPQERWEKWKARFQKSEYDWRQHSGVQWKPRGKEATLHAMDSVKDSLRRNEILTHEHAA